jgi:DNA-binding response OmpR family regulator
MLVFRHTNMVCHGKSKKEFKYMQPSRILIIDDEKEICSLLKEYFESENYVVSCAHNGLDGIETQKLFKASIILLDMRMPGISGIETLIVLKKLGPANVICVSAVTEINIAEECLKNGASAYIFKPINLEDLMDQVKVCQNELKK